MAFIMSNKEQLQTNNAALDALITRVNAAKDTAASLPEAGGGASIETVTMTVQNNGYMSFIYSIYCLIYVDGALMLSSPLLVPVGGTTEYQVPETSIVFIQGYSTVEGLHSLYSNDADRVVVGIAATDFTVIV